MSRKHYSPEQIIYKLREAEVLISQGLTIIDEYTRECLAIDVGRSLTRESVIERLTDLFIQRGIPENIRSDNGSEFTAKAIRRG